MKQTTILSLLQTGYTTVNVSYDVNTTAAKNCAQCYTFKTHLKLVDDDLVVVPNGPGFKICRVMEVHKEPKIDLEATYEYKWIASRLNLADYYLIVEKEAIDIKRLNDMAANKKRHEILDGLKLTYGEEEIKVLTSDINS